MQGTTGLRKAQLRAGAVWHGLVIGSLIALVFIRQVVPAQAGWAFDDPAAEVALRRSGCVRAGRVPTTGGPAARLELPASVLAECRLGELTEPAQCRGGDRRVGEPQRGGLHQLSLVGASRSPRPLAGGGRTCQSGASGTGGGAEWLDQLRRTVFARYDLTGPVLRLQDGWPAGSYWPKSRACWHAWRAGSGLHPNSACLSLTCRRSRRRPR